MGFFNRMAAIQYALKWALSRNPAFPNYSGHSGGGDCTNFISQVMLAGGWPMIRGPGWNWHDWWSIDGESSRTWASANWFSMYLDVTPRTSKCEMEDLALGDIVQMQTPEFDNPDHTMVVTARTYGLSSNLIFLTYHSTDTYQRSLQDIQSHYPSDTKYFYWKVLDLFPEPERAAARAIEERGHIGNKI